MTELEQLRKEINELRERVAVLERMPTPGPAPHTILPPSWTPQPQWVPPTVT